VARAAPSLLRLAFNAVWLLCGDSDEKINIPGKLEARNSRGAVKVDWLKMASDKLIGFGPSNHLGSDRLLMFGRRGNHSGRV
jgi:hypothetical protein